MASLTEPRLKKAKDILDRYASELVLTKKLNEAKLEKELKDVWDLSYVALKTIMVDLLKHDEYRLLAARYMESGSPGVAAEFKQYLAKLYGITHYDAKDREEKQNEFWARELGV